MKKFDICEEFTTTSLEVMKTHQAKEHRNEVIPNHRCRLCSVSFTNNVDFQAHLDSSHPSENTFEMIQHAYEKRLRIYKRNIRKKAVDTLCLWLIFQDFKNLCRRLIATDFPVMKFNLCLFGIFKKLSPDESEHQTEIFVLKSTHFVIKPYTKLKNIWSSIIKNYDDRIDEYLLKGSGWALTEVLKVHVEVSKVEPLQFSCQEPKFNPSLATKAISGRKHLINIENTEYNCFLTCLAFHYLKKQNPEIKKTLKNASHHHSLYKKFIEGLNYNGTGIFPPYNKPYGIKKMKKLLKNNKKMLGDLQVNIFGLLDSKIYAYEIGMGSKKSKLEKIILQIVNCYQCFIQFIFNFR